MRGGQPQLGLTGRSLRTVGRRMLFLLAGAFAGRLDRADEDMRITPFKTRYALDTAVLREVFGEAHEQFLAEVCVGNLAAAELHHGLDAIPFLEEADGVLHLEVV